MSENPLDTLFESFVFCVPLERFFYKSGGQWALDTPVGDKGMLSYLVSHGLPTPAARAALKSCSYRVVQGVDIVPNAPDIVEQDGVRLLNAWQAPTLAPERGPYPRIAKILGWLTGNDDEGVEWLKNWIAQKAQRPELSPKVAVVFCGQQGSGKGTVSYIMHQMLGKKNCSEINHKALASRFNGRWVKSLFVLGDEVVTSENFVHVAEELKILIASESVEMERKKENQLVQRNRMAWIFATNTDLVPVLVEEGDRRYSVFTNHSPLDPNYKAMVEGNFLPNHEPTPEFTRELQAFYAEMLAWPVDYELVKRPYQNRSRERLIQASLPAQKAFLQLVDSEGIDDLLDETREIPLQSKSSWDFGEAGLSKRVVYRVYKDYCRNTGASALREQKFFNAVENHHPRWEEVAIPDPRSPGHLVKCYKVRRTIPQKHTGASAPAPGLPVTVN